MRAPESFAHSSLAAANSANFPLVGGAYALDVIATWNSGSLTLQRLGPDNATFITAATALTADGTSGSLALPPGTYRFLVASATNLWAQIVRIPGE